MEATEKSHPHRRWWGRLKPCLGDPKGAAGVRLSLRRCEPGQVRRVQSQPRSRWSTTPGRPQQQHSKCHTLYLCPQGVIPRESWGRNLVRLEKSANVRIGVRTFAPPIAHDFVDGCGIWRPITSGEVPTSDGDEPRVTGPSRSRGVHQRPLLIEADHRCLDPVASIEESE